MKSGTCPKCGQSAVRHTLEDFRLGGGTGVTLITGMINRPSPVDAYICTNCGYLETYVADPEKLGQIAEKWPPPSSGS